MNKELILSAILLGCSSPLALAQTCDVEIKGEVPAHISLDKLFVSVYQRYIPVSAHQFSVCATKKDLNVTGQHNPNNKVYLVDKSADTPLYLYSSLVFVQTKHIELDSISTLANYACDSRCGYYSYQRIQNDAELISLAQQYSQIDAKAKAERSAFTLRHQATLGQLYTKVADIKALDANRMTEINNPDLWVDPYRGAGLLFESKTNLQSTAFMEGIGDNIRNIMNQNPDLKPLVTPHKKDLRVIAEGRLSWEQKGEAIDALAAQFKTYNQPKLDEIIKILKDSYRNASPRFQDYLSNKYKTPFATLNQADTTFELVLANWSLAAYSHSQDKQKFSALFTERFKQEQLPIQDKELDSALSRLITLPNHLGQQKLADGYKNIQIEFKDRLSPSNERYDFKDDLQSLSFIYEQGAWRLDNLSQVPINHYEL